MLFRSKNLSFNGRNIGFEKNTSLLGKNIEVTAKSTVTFATIKPSLQVRVDSPNTTIKADTVVIGPNIDITDRSSGAILCKKVLFMKDENDAPLSPGQRKIKNWIPQATKIVYIPTLKNPFGEVVNR